MAKRLSAAHRDGAITTVEELASHADGLPDYEEAEFSLPQGKVFRCKLKIIKDGAEWGEIIRQAQARMERSRAKGGYTFQVGEGESATIADPNIAAALTYVAQGMLEPKIAFAQAAVLFRKTGKLLLEVAIRIREINEAESFEQAKNASRQATGPDLPESPASPSSVSPSADV
jgi:hypothetical protein